MLASTVLVFACAAPVFAESVTLFRVFLNDGTAVVSYGEYARVGDRVVFSMPIGAIQSGNRETNLHVVNLPVSAVNWESTTRYAESARLSHYMTAFAESDYTALAGEIAATLNAIVITSDPKARLSMAVEARRRLASWPRDHYGYRANDVQEMLGLLDDAINGLRVAAGETSFSVDLVATAPAATSGPPHSRTGGVPLLGSPTTAGSIEQAMAVAEATDIAADRVSILRSVVAGLDEFRSDLPVSLTTAVRSRAARLIREELRTGSRYAGLTSSVLNRAARAAARADVRGVEKLLQTAMDRDAKWGSRRRDEMSALLDQVRVHLDAAQKLRLARDHWRERAPRHRAYAKLVAPVFDGLVRARTHLDDIKRLTGSDAEVLVSLADRFGRGVTTLSAISVPEELKGSHALLTSAVNLAETAVRARRQAAVSGDLSLARDASSAAAGSIMLLTKAREDLDMAIRLPQIR